MAPQPKGKQGTKGAKQIVEENASTLSFYRNMVFGSVAMYSAFMMIFTEGYSMWDVAFFLFAIAVQIGCMQFMKFMGNPKYGDSEGKQLLDSGVDLNMQAGVAEHVKDLIILTCGCLVLSFFSRYFWLFWLLVPLKGIYYAWTKLIAPWVFAPAPEPSANEDKKARKLDRRMRR